MIHTQMRQVIELIRKHPKMRRILRCESPYFHHWYQANAPTLMRYNFLTHTPKLIIFGTHNLQIFTHHALINELLLMQFYVYSR